MARPRLSPDSRYCISSVVKSNFDFSFQFLMAEIEKADKKIRQEGRKLYVHITLICNGIVMHETMSIQVLVYP